MVATKFCALTQNLMSIAYLVRKSLQNIVQGAGSGTTKEKEVTKEYTAI